METTIGQLRLRRALPEDIDLPLGKPLDKKAVQELLDQVAERHPDKYKDVFNALSEVGKDVAWQSGVTVSLSGLRKSKAKEQVLRPIREKLAKLIADERLPAKERDRRIVELVASASDPLKEALMAEAKAEGNPFYAQIASGARGNPASFSSLRGADLVVSDQEGKPVPIPVLNSYAEGLTPAEYFATSYGQRSGMINVKMATADAGYLSKQLSGAAHRIVVTKDAPPETRLPVGFPTTVDDPDNVGAVLVRDAGPYKAGDVLTRQHLSRLKQAGVDDILVHSTLTEPSEDGGVSRLAAGRRSRAGLGHIGDNIGLASSQSITERLSQGMLDSKHSAGVNTRVSKSGFEYLNRLFQAPAEFPESGPLAEDDGEVTKITDAPQGGKIITVGEREYYVNKDLDVTVKVGDTVEQGDDLTNGTPHPSDLVRLRGMGEARRTYLKELGEGLRASGVPYNRRNLETLVGGLLNWAKVTSPDGLGDNQVDDIVPFNRAVYNYKPRPTSKRLALSLTKGKYLEEPVLHYTPGTKINRRVMDELKRWDIRDLVVDDDPPDFEPHMVRAVQSTFHDPDWRVRLGGFYTATSFKDSVRRGLESDTNSTSYYPGLTNALGFGQKIRQTGHYGS